jgi:hypothetical protein
VSGACDVGLLQDPLRRIALGSAPVAENPLVVFPPEFAMQFIEDQVGGLTRSGEVLCVGCDPGLLSVDVTVTLNFSVAGLDAELVELGLRELLRDFATAIREMDLDVFVVSQTFPMNQYICFHGHRLPPDMPQAALKNAVGWTECAHS